MNAWAETPYPPQIKWTCFRGRQHTFTIVRPTGMRLPTPPVNAQKQHGAWHRTFVGHSSFSSSFSWSEGKHRCPQRVGNAITLGSVGPRNASNVTCQVETLLPDRGDAVSLNILTLGGTKINSGPPSSHPTVAAEQNVLSPSPGT